MDLPKRDAMRSADYYETIVEEKSFRKYNLLNTNYVELIIKSSSLKFNDFDFSETF